MNHSCHRAKGRGRVGAKWEMGRVVCRFFTGKDGGGESPLGRNLHFSDITVTLCDLKKTGNNGNRNNTPASGESSKQRILFFERPLLHLDPLLLLTPVLKSVWGPFCLSMMSYLARVVAICQDTHTQRYTKHVHGLIHTHTHTHRHTHRHTHSRSLFPPQFLRAGLFAGVRSPSLVFCSGHRFYSKPQSPASTLAGTSQYYL